MDRKTWLRGEIGAWRAEGVVDEATAERLLARYGGGGGVSWGIVLAGAFGAFLVGLGLIALVAANWDEFGREARTALAVAPVAVCGLAAAWAGSRGKTGAAVMEPIGVLWLAAVAAGSTIVAQTYQIGDSVAGLLLFIAVLGIPLLFATRSMAATVAWAVLGLVWAAEQASSTGYSWGLALGAAAGVVVISAAAWAVVERSRAEGGLKATGRVLLGGVWAVGVPWMAVAVRPWVWDAKFGYDWLLLFWVAAAVLWTAGRFGKRKEWSVVATWAGAGASAAAFVPENPEWLQIPVYAVGLAHAAALAFGGIRGKRLWVMNAGVLLGMWLVLAKFFESDLDFTAKGVLLIAGGLAVLGLNVWMVRTKKREAAK